MLEYDTTSNRFLDELVTEPPRIRKNVKQSGGTVPIPEGPGLGVEPDMDFLRSHSIDNMG